MRTVRTLLGSLHLSSKVCESRLATPLALILLLVVGCGDASDGTVTFSAGPTRLAFAAVQDDDGPWTVVTPSNDGMYVFPASGKTYGIAVVCGDSAFATITIVQATVAETTSQRFDCNVVSDHGASISGSFASASGQAVSVHVANRGTGTSAGTYAISMLPAGEWDIFALRAKGSLVPVDPDRIVRRNAVTLASGAPTAVDFDFAAEGFSTESHMVSIQGAQPGEVNDVRTRLRNKPGGTFVELGPFDGGRFVALPSSALRNDDVHMVTASALTPDGSARQVRQWFITAEDFTASLPPLPQPPLIESEAPLPYLRMRGTVPSAVDADRYDFVYRQSTAPNGYVIWTASLTRGYVATSSSTYTLPDLAAIAGFTPSWGLMPAREVEWEFTTHVSDAGVAALLQADQRAAELDGRQDQITQRKGTFLR